MRRMTFVGMIAFFGMAVVTMDVLGGVIAATFLARGLRPVHLLAFVGGYAVSVVIVTILLKPILTFVGRWVGPVLASETWVAVIQLVVGIALVGVGIHQRHRALHPPTDDPATRRQLADKASSLLMGGLLLSLTTYADPTFTIAVGLAMQTHSLWQEVSLLTIWNLIYQLPLVVVTVTSLFGAHEKVIDVVGRFFARHRRGLLMLLAAVLVIAGSALLIDALVALLGTHRPWFTSLLLLREEHPG